MKKISKETIAQIDNYMFEIISTYVDLKKSGSLYKGLSPFVAEKTPSFIFTPSKSIWKDFSSGKGGKSAIKFVMELEGIHFKDAVIKCANIAGIDVEYEDGSEEEMFFENAIDSLKYFFTKNLNKVSLDYLYSRGITDESIKKWEIGFAPSYKTMVDFFNKSSYKKELIKMNYFYKKDNGDIHPKFYNRIMFPINNHYGKTVGFSGRDITGKAKAKYVNSNDFDFFKKSKILFGLDKIKNISNKLIVVEGQIDVILSHQYGVEICVASQGTAFTQYHFNLIKDKDVLFCFDGDKAGINATNKAVELFLKNGVEPKVVILPEGYDVADILTSKGKNFLFGLLKKNTKGIDYIIDALVNHVPDDKKIASIEEIKSKISLFPMHISEKILSKLTTLTKNIELQNKNNNNYIEEKIIIKFILENGLEKEFIEPFKDCFKIKFFKYYDVKDAPNINENEFYDIWKEFELSCYKKRIKTITKSDLSYQEKKEKINELKECLNATKYF